MIGFFAMNTGVRLSAPEIGPEAEERLADRVLRVFVDHERRFSRFLPSSELSRLNRANGPVRVADELFDALARAKSYFELTGGIFDPAIGKALIASGYDRSFDPAAFDREERPSRCKSGRFGEVELDPATRTVSRPPHIQLDFGGFVKGYTVDRCAELLPSVAAIDAGGDCRVKADDGWEVEIEDPEDASRTLLILRVRDRAVATSAANRRTWMAGGEKRHHLIDPRTGAPARTDLAQATIVAECAELADVLATTAYVLGMRGAIEFLGRLKNVAAVLVGADQSLVRLGELEVVDG